MKKILLAILLALMAPFCFGQSYPSPTYNNLTVAGTFTATGLVTTTDLATQAANTVLANATGSVASPTAFAMPGCSTSTSALQWTSGTGFVCGSSFAGLGGATFTGASGLSYSGATFTLNDSTGGSKSQLIFQKSGVISWSLSNASNASNTFGLDRFNSGGSYIDTPLQVLNSTGLAAFADGISSNSSSNAITGGAINNASLGATTPSSGAFTTLTASTATTYGDNSTNAATTQFVAKHEPCVNIDDHGGDPTNTNDNTTALNNSIAAAAHSGDICVQFGTGTYKFTSSWSYTIAANTGITLKGLGQDVTNLNFSSSTTGGWTLTYSAITSSAHIRDVSFLAGGAYGTADGLTLTTSASIPNPANSALSDVTRVTFRGNDGYSVTNHWTDGITVKSVSNVNFYGINITGSSGLAGNGIQILGASTAIPVQFNISSSTFENLNIGFVYGTFTQGVTINNCNFTGGAFGIVSNGTSLAQLGVSNSQFNNSTNALQLNTNVPGLQLTGNLFIIASTNAVGITITNPGLYEIQGNMFQGNLTSGTAGISFTTAGSAAGVITGNTFYRLVTGINLNSSSSGVNVQSNAYSTNTTNVANTGANAIGGGSP